MNGPRADPVRRIASPADRPGEVVDPSKTIIRARISTPTPDRAGDVVRPEGLINPERYLKNPVVLWAHQRSIPPIGFCQSLEVTPEGIIAETRFSQTSPLGMEIFQLYAEGILRAWSIGFLPRQTRTRPGQKRGMTIETWELLEYSAVPIPENPEALTLAIRKGRLDSLRRWQASQRDVLGRLIASSPQATEFDRPA